MTNRCKKMHNEKKLKEAERKAQRKKNDPKKLKQNNKKKNKRMALNFEENWKIGCEFLF